MVEELLRELKKLPGLEGRLSARILDDGDAVAAWEGGALAAVLFPTAETLGEVRKIAEARRSGGAGREGGLGRVELQRSRAGWVGHRFTSWFSRA